MALQDTVIAWLAQRTFDEIATPDEKAAQAGPVSPGNEIADPTIQLVRDSMMALISGMSHSQVRKTVYDLAEFASSGRKLSLSMRQIRWLDRQRRLRVEELTAEQAAGALRRMARRNG